jgi:thiamine biosynthesis lipoprotein
MISHKRFLIIFIAATVFLVNCGPKEKEIFGREYTGTILGNPYVISTAGDSTDYQFEIDSIIRLIDINFSLSNPNSVISKYNMYTQIDESMKFVDSSFVFGSVFNLAEDLNRRSNSFFDPTSNPLKREWFRIKFNQIAEEPNLDSLYEFVVFDSKVDLNEIYDESGKYKESHLRKKDPRIELDLSSLGMAYGLDMISDMLLSKGIQQIKITCLNQTICRGAGVPELNIVPLGITQDSADQKIRLINGAFSFKTTKEKQAMIDVTYGYPVDNEIVYVGVAAKSLVEAEVFSESFMIMGFEQSSSWYEKNADSNVHSFMLFMKNNEISSASTIGFDEMLIVPDSITSK